MIVDLLQQRCSVRQFADRPVPPAVLDQILEAGRLAPSGGNEQPWRFGVITERERIAAIAGMSYNQAWVGGAAFLIVLCVVNYPAERGGRDVQMARYPAYAAAIAGMEKELYNRIHQEEHQTKIPGTLMALAALEQGVGSTWVSYFAVDEVSRYLNLPADCLAAEILAFGYPAQAGRMRPKKSREEIVFYNRFA